MMQPALLQPQPRPGAAGRSRGGQHHAAGGVDVVSTIFTQYLKYHNIYNEYLQVRGDTPTSDTPSSLHRLVAKLPQVMKMRGHVYLYRV